MRESIDWLYRDLRGVVHEANNTARARGCDEYRFSHNTMRARDARFPTCLWCAIDAR